jgi:hypothetical protein
VCACLCISFFMTNILMSFWYSQKSVGVWGLPRGGGLGSPRRRPGAWPQNPSPPPKTAGKHSTRVTPPPTKPRKSVCVSVSVYVCGWENALCVCVWKSKVKTERER